MSDATCDPSLGLSRELRDVGPQALALFITLMVVSNLREDEM